MKKSSVLALLISTVLLAVSIVSCNSLIRNIGQREEIVFPVLGTWSVKSSYPQLNNVDMVIDNLIPEKNAFTGYFTTVVVFERYFNPKQTFKGIYNPETKKVLMVCTDFLNREITFTADMVAGGRQFYLGEFYATDQGRSGYETWTANIKTE